MDQTVPAFEVDSEEHAIITALLANYMSDLSEDAYSAGWIQQCEYAIWREMQENDPNKGGRFIWFIPSQRCANTLTLLSNMINGWVMWSEEKDEPVFVPMEEWLDLYQKWNTR